MTTYTGLSTAPAHRRLEAFFGITGDHQRRVGTVVLLCSMIERDAEILCWMLAGEEPATGVRSTDKATISDLLKRLRKAAEGPVSIEYRPLASLLTATVQAAADLFDVRNTIVHGRPVVDPVGAPSLTRNPSWLGESRSRPATTLAITDDVLDQVAEVALCVNLVLAGSNMMLGGAVPAGLVLEREDEMNARRAEIAKIAAGLSSAP